MSADPRFEPAEFRHGDYIAALDGLRAFAVIAVLLFHADVSWMRGGFLGVDLFFALSGWLITSLLLREASSSGTVRLTVFWRRRIRRLMPAALAMLGAVLLWGWLYAKPYERDVVLQDAPWAQYYLANWHQIRTSVGYWASFDSPSPFDHLWSLAIEEQFYLLWPIVIWAVVRVARKHLHIAVLAVTTAGSIASFVAMLALYHGGDPTRVYMGTDTRAASLLVGAALATAPMMRAIGALVRALRQWIDVVLVVLTTAMATMWIGTDGTSATWLFRGGLLAHSAMGALVVAVVASARSTLVARGLAWTPLVAIGKISYGLYLWHWPIYVIADEERTGLDGASLVLVRLAISFAVAIASYYVVERPIRTRKWVRTRPVSVSATLLAMASITALIVAVPRPEGNVAAVDAASVAAAISIQPPPTTAAAPTTTAATSTAAPTTIAEVSAVPATTTTAPATTVPVVRPTVHSVVWWGDSIAFDAGPGLDASLAAAGLDVADVSYSGQRILPTEPRFDPGVKIPEALRKAAPFDLVIAQFSVWDLDAPEVEQDLGLEALFGFVTDVQPDASLVLVTPPPTADRGFDDDGRVRMVEAAHTLAARHPGRVWVIDSAALWGTTYARDMDGDGIPERKADGVHICPSGAARFGAWLTNELAARFDGVTPSTDLAWVGGEWTGSKRYNDPPGTCDAVS